VGASVCSDIVACARSSYQPEQRCDSHLAECKRDVLLRVCVTGFSADQFPENRPPGWRKGRWGEQGGESRKCAGRRALSGVWRPRHASRFIGSPSVPKRRVHLPAACFEEHFRSVLIRDRTRLTWVGLDLTTGFKQTEIEVKKCFFSLTLPSLPPPFIQESDVGFTIPYGNCTCGHTRPPGLRPVAATAALRSCKGTLLVPLRW
jgi:hypothetical protein